MVRTCRLAPTMATLILAPWEFWLSCKNRDQGGNTDLCLSQEGVCRAAGGRWVTRRLQGSDPLDLWPNSISPSTISLPLSDIISQAKQNSYPMPALEKLQHTHFLSSLCFLLHAYAPQLKADCLATIGPCLHASFWESASRCFGELMLHWCLVAMGPGLRPWHKGMTFLFSCIVTYWVDTNYPAFRSTNLAATYWAGVKQSPFMWGVFWSGCSDYCETLAPSVLMQGEGMWREESLEQWAPLRKASKSWWLTSKEPLVSKPVLWLELDTLFPWI